MLVICRGRYPTSGGRRGHAHGHAPTDRLGNRPPLTLKSQVWCRTIPCAARLDGPTSRETRFNDSYRFHPAQVSGRQSGHRRRRRVVRLRHRRRARGHPRRLRGGVPLLAGPADRRAGPHRRPRGKALQGARRPARRHRDRGDGQAAARGGRRGRLLRRHLRLLRHGGAAWRPSRRSRRPPTARPTSRNSR